MERVLERGVYFISGGRLSRRTYLGGRIFDTGLLLKDGSTAFSEYSTSCR